MTRTVFSSPKLTLTITPEHEQEAIRSNSGGCLIADQIEAQYPGYSKIVVDMATISFSDAKKGVRYTYITPPEAQHLLLSFDQGWAAQGERKLTIKRAVLVRPMIQNKSRDRTAEFARVKRLRALEAKERKGEKLTRTEQATLTRIRNRKTPPERPGTAGPAVVKVSGRNSPVVFGGHAPVTGPNHPNLLRGRDRHFGAKLADPGRIFQEAVEAEVQARLEAQAKG